MIPQTSIRYVGMAQFQSVGFTDASFPVSLNQQNSQGISVQ